MTLWDGLLPAEVQLLPTQLRLLDELLQHDEVLAPFRAHWGAVMNRGRPSIPMAVYLRMMVIKHRAGWGYERLRAEISDSLHLRRFCQLQFNERVPDESTVRKLTRRLGPELVDDLTRKVIQVAASERDFTARAARCDSTVVRADIRFPTDSGLAAHAVKVLAQAGRNVARTMPDVGRQIEDRSRAVDDCLRTLGRTLKRRTGEAKQDVERLTKEIAHQAEASLAEARAQLAQIQELGAAGQRAASGAALSAARRLEEVIGLGERVVEQVRKRFAGEKIENRLVSLADPDARPIRKGRLPQATEFGYVNQLTELTSSTERGAKGLLLPPKILIGSVNENTLLPLTVEEMQRLELRPAEAAVDGAFGRKETREALEEVGVKTLFISGTGIEGEGSQDTRRQLASYRVGCEGRISHLKREYGAGRTRLRGITGVRSWESWAILAYNLDTTARMPVRDP